MRIVLIGAAVALFILSLGLAVRYNQEAGAAREKLDGERYKRIVAEESLQKADARVDSLTAELKKAETKVQSAETVLEKTKMVNKDLKMRLDKASEIQKNLEEKLAEIQGLAVSK